MHVLFPPKLLAGQHKHAGPPCAKFCYALALSHTCKHVHEVRCTPPPWNRSVRSPRLRSRGPPLDARPGAPDIAPAHACGEVSSTTKHCMSRSGSCALQTTCTLRHTCACRCSDIGKGVQTDSACRIPRLAQRCYLECEQQPVRSRHAAGARRACRNMRCASPLLPSLPSSTPRARYARKSAGGGAAWSQRTRCPFTAAQYCSC